MVSAVSVCKIQMQVWTNDVAKMRFLSRPDGFTCISLGGTVSLFLHVNSPQVLSDQGNSTSGLPLGSPFSSWA